MRGGEPALEARAAAVSGEAVFVGRERELRVLGERLERALAGTGSLVLLAGDPGIGKTRTLGEFVDSARAHGALTPWGSSFEGDWHPPYGPWVEALGDIARSLDPAPLRRDLGSGAPVLARLLPELAATLGDVPAVAPLGPEEDRFRLFDAVAQFLVAVARRQPVVLVLDDLHWTDRDSLQLLAYCGRFVARGGLVLVGAYRDAAMDLGDPLADTLAVLCRQAGYEHLALGGLSPEEVADYLARANRQPPPEALVRAIHAETGGNPFYLRQLWRHLVDERVAVQRHGRWVLTAELGGAGVRVPQGVRHVLARRLARLSATASTVLHAAAALTAGFDFAILQTITGLPEEVLLGCLDEAVGAGLLQVGRRPGGTYDFVHPIVRHTLYDDLNPDRRARLHRRLAEALEQAQAAGTVAAAAEIAVQYHASATLPGADRGLDHALGAAAEATAGTAHERAVTLLRIACDLARSRDAATRAEVWSRLALAEGDALLLADAERSTVRALDALAEAGAEPSASAELVAAAVRKLRDGGAPPEVCEPLVERGLALLGGARDLTWARLALLRDRFETVSTGTVFATRWLGYDSEAIALARTAGDEDDYAHTLEPFDWRTREETAAVLALARRWRRPAAVITALNVACRDALFLHGAFADALARGQELLEAATRYGSLPGQAEAMAAIAAARRATADLPLARQTAEDAAELIARLHPDHRLHVIVDVPLATMLAYYLGGDWAELARRAADRAGTPAAGRPGLLGLHVGACAALAYARAGQPASAERLLAALLPVLERVEPTMHHHTFTVHYSATAAWELGAAHRAASLRRLVERLAGAGAGDSLVASHSLCLARMSALSGEWARAAQELAEARRDLDASGHRPLRAIADHDEALMLLRAGSGDAARIGALLADALDAFRALGMTDWEHRTLALRAPPPAAGGLTPREVEVLRLISAGRTTRQIAETLTVSRATVERHITSLYRKIGARGRADATSYALRQGVADRGEGFPSPSRPRKVEAIPRWQARTNGGGCPDDMVDRPVRRQVMRQRSLERAALDGVELEYEVRGAGEPVMLVHAGACGDWFKGLIEEPALAGRHRLVRYHRVGYGGSSHLPGPVSLADQAAHCRSLMRHLGIGRAHVVGHSSSANIALQLALDTPEAVGSLALLEPALLAVPTGPYGAQAMERYHAGDKAGAVDTWMRGVCGPDWRAVFEQALPGAVEQAVADADTFLGQELPAVRGWSFGQEDARRVTQPALAVLGARTREVTPVFDQRHELLLAWLPNVEPFVLPEATHLLHLQNRLGMANGLAAFFARHPL